MICLINSSNLPYYLPKMSKGLLRASDKTDIENFWTLDDLVTSINSNDVIVFVQEDTDYFGVLQVCHSPRNKILSFFWSGQDISNPTQPDYDEVDHFLTDIAKKLGCGVIQCEGRLGWTPLMKSRGYSVDSALFTRKVTDELSNV